VRTSIFGCPGKPKEKKGRKTKQKNKGKEERKTRAEKGDIVNSRFCGEW
jgi:hypothetical protein